MKKIVETISSNERQIIEIIALIVAGFIPQIFDLQEMFKDYLNANPISPDNLFWQITLRKDNNIASFLIICAVLFMIRKFNKGFVMNRKRVYHDYCYAWYWFSAKILGITSCDLVLVPIYMQFKLVLNATFLEYPLDDTEYPLLEEELESTILDMNQDGPTGEINLVLEDTYAIEKRQIPKTKQKYRTIKISRNNGADSSRHFSQKYIETVSKSVRSLKRRVTVNVYATTNPLNTKHIAKRVFGLGERGNIQHLYVFRQSKDGIRKFEEKGRKIF